MSNTKKKKDNIFVAYFRPFGLKQVCDILMLVSAIIMVVGAFAVNDIVLLVGLIIFIAADAVMLIKSVLVLVGKTNRKSPEYRNAISATIFTGVMLALALFGLIYFFVI